MRSPGAVPSAIAAMIRGDRKARGASRRMCRSPRASRSATSAKEPMRPSRMSSIHPRALAMAASRALGFLDSYARPRALCRAGGIPGLAFLEHCYPLAMSTRSAATTTKSSQDTTAKDHGEPIPQYDVLKGFDQRKARQICR